MSGSIGFSSDSFVVKVDTLPKPFVKHDTICFGEDSVEFDAGTGWE